MTGPRQETYSLEILPFFQLIQSTLPAPSFHSSPMMASNSALVKPGGRRRHMSFRRGWVALGPRGACDGAFFWRTATGRTPLTPAWGGMLARVFAGMARLLVVGKLVHTRPAFDRLRAGRLGLEADRYRG
jgi:hypothetical protein